jgi:LacI family transcriptional regulator
MPTIYDVAKLAEVSHTAASAVLNNRPVRVGDDTRKRILNAAKSLGYRANRAAQQLATGKFNAIALCFKRTGQQIFENPASTRMIAGVMHSASENGLNLLFAPTRPVYKFEETINSLPSHGADGGVVIGPIPLAKKGVQVINQSATPLVIIDSHPGFVSAGTVDIDNFLGMKKGVEHLIANGHKKMAYIAPAPEFACLLDRMRGFYEAVREAELSLADQMTHIVPSETVPEVVRHSVEATSGPTALVCADATVARAVMDEVLRLGLQIPGDVSILAFGEVLGHPLSESIDTIRGDAFAIGKAAGDLLKKLIDGECSGPVSIRLPAEFVMRACEAPEGREEGRASDR